jgi:shikimate kinase
MNIYLVGYRCTGKSSVGQQLAASLGWAFVDTDSRVVTQAGQEIAAIVKKNGWAHFRRLEQSCLRAVADRHHQVVATGGGIVLDAHNVKIMKTSGVVVWLTAAPDIIRQRMRGDRQTENQRPALTDRNVIDEIETVLNERMPLYRAASEIVIDTGLASLQELVKGLTIRLTQFDIKPDSV